MWSAGCAVSDRPRTGLGRQGGPPDLECHQESVTTVGQAPSPGTALRFEPGDSIGQALRAARLAAGLTAYEVAQILRIRPGRLIEIEGDDFTGCGAPVLARGRLAAIARAVGVDPAPLLAAFDAEQSTPVQLPLLPAVPRLRPGRRNWTHFLFVAFAVVALYPFALLCAAVFG